MTDSYAVSLWDGPNSEKIVSVDAQGPRDAARMAEDANPGWQAHFVGRFLWTTASGRCVKCGGVSLVGDPIVYDGKSGEQTCAKCVLSPLAETIR
jgi:hypothetical protein